jgi:imidazolonepropionase-like amidohydrolase
MMRKTLTTLLVLGVLATPTLAQSARTPQSRTLALTHVTVIDATGAPPMRNMTVVITGDRITEIGKSGGVRIPRNARVVNASGKYLIPGLWDMHVHLAKAGENTLSLFIANGVTSVRDMGGDPTLTLKWRDEVAKGKRLGPRIKAAGPILESASNVARLKSEGTVEPVDRFRIGVASAEEAVKAVNLVARLGADFVKVRTIESIETYRAIAKATKLAGLTLVGHAVASPEEMIQAGQRSIEHPLRPPLDGRTEAERAELFQQFAQRGLAIVPTIVVGLKSLYIPKGEAAPIVEDSKGRIDYRRRYLSGYLIEDWREQVKEREDSAIEDLKKMRPSVMRDLKEMHRAGVRIMPGTDVGVVLIYPGFSLHDELQLLVSEVGLTPMEAIISATRSPAEFFGLQQSLGTIEKGKIADLVLLDANPLDQISNTQRIAGVIVAGRFLPKSKLRRMLANVEAVARVASKKQ